MLCEKPLAMSLDDARAMVKAARDAGVVMATNHHLRNAATHRAMRDAIAAGKIGKPLGARVFHAGLSAAASAGLAARQAGSGRRRHSRYHRARHRYAALRARRRSGRGDRLRPERRHGARRGWKMPSWACCASSPALIAQFHDGFTTKYAVTGFEVHGTEGSLIGRNVHDPEAGRHGDAAQRRWRDRTAARSHAISTRTALRRLRRRRSPGRASRSATGEDGIWSLATGLAVVEVAQGPAQSVKIEPGL